MFLNDEPTGLEKSPNGLVCVEIDVANVVEVKIPTQSGGMLKGHFDKYVSGDTPGLVKHFPRMLQVFDNMTQNCQVKLLVGKGHDLPIKKANLF